MSAIFFTPEGVTLTSDKKALLSKRRRLVRIYKIIPFKIKKAERIETRSAFLFRKLNS